MCQLYYEVRILILMVNKNINIINSVGYVLKIVSYCQFQ